MENKHVWLIGVGGMSVDYSKVLLELGCNITCIGRGEASASQFTEKTGIDVKQGGLSEFLSEKPAPALHAIVSVGAEQLASCTKKLCEYGIKNILVEKPGGLTTSEISQVYESSKQNKNSVFIGYNRRFYQSVEKAKRIANTDGGITSFNFEFTEWSHKLKDVKKAEGVMERWFLCNSTHIVNLAFYLGGNPEKIDCNSAGQLSWHPSSSVFTGSGKTSQGALFSYHSNWSAPGRWGAEFCTSKHRLILRPLETLQIQEIGSIHTQEVEIDDSIDKRFKPGLFNQTKAFITNPNDTRLCTLSDHLDCMSTYSKMSGYDRLNLI